MIVKTDIDIDTKNRSDLLNLIKHTPAGIVKDNDIKIIFFILFMGLDICVLFIRFLLLLDASVASRSKSLVGNSRGSSPWRRIQSFNST